MNKTVEVSIENNQFQKNYDNKIKFHDNVEI